MVKCTGHSNRLKFFFCLALACLMTLTCARGFTLKVGDIFVANFGGGNILKVDPQSGAQQNWGAIVQPTDVAPSSDGYIYISGLNNTISKMCIGNGAIIPLTTGGLLNHPYGIALAPSGDLFVTSFGNSLIVKVDHLTGAQTQIASGGSLSGPLGIAFNAVGNLVVANYNSSSILEIDPNTGTQTTIIAGRGLNHPHHLTVDPSGNIFVGNDAANAGNIIQKVTPGSTTITNVATADKLKSPRGIATEGNGRLISSQFDDKKIVRVDPANGNQPGVSSGGLLNQPYGVAVYNFPAVPTDICSPELNISQNGQNIVLAWPTNSVGFTVKMTTGFAPSNSWTTLANSVRVVGTNYAVSLNATGGGGFFRLQK
jgi:hypothetical protein